MSAQRRTFSDPLEPIIYWDASFAIGFTLQQDPRHGECSDFQLRMEAEESLAVVSDFAYDEMSFIIIRRQLAEEGKKLGLHWAGAFKAQPDLLQLALPQLDAAISDLDVATLQLPIPLETPDYIYESKIKRTSHLYFREIMVTPMGTLYLMVVADMRTRAKRGFVETAFLVEGLAKGGALLWQRT